MLLNKTQESEVNRLATLRENSWVVEVDYKIMNRRISAPIKSWPSKPCVVYARCGYEADQPFLCQ
jgi:hypothetical protein